MKRLLSIKRGMKQPIGVIYSKVPGASPVELVSYYRHFIDYYPTCELETKEWFVKNVKPDWVAIDAGANIGYHSVLLGRLAYQGFCFAYEPTSTFQMLEANIAKSGLKNVIALKKPLGSKSGFFKERLFRIWGKPPELLGARFVTIDDEIEKLNLHRLDLIKIDVDGFDFEVLIGASKAIKEYRPAVLIEINEALATRNVSSWDVFEFLNRNGYSRGIVLDKNNYLFRWNGKTQQEGNSFRMELEFKYSDALQKLDVHLEPFLHFPIPIMGKRQLHNSTLERLDFNFELNGMRWDYAVTIPIPLIVSAMSAVSLQVEVMEGVLGIFIENKSGKILTPEIFMSQNSSPNCVIRVPQEGSENLVFRQAGHEGLKFRISSVSIAEILSDDI